MAFRAVHEGGDGQEIVADRQLAAGEKRPGRDAELMIAGFAFPEVAGFVGVEAKQPHFGQCGSPLVSAQRMHLKASRASSSDIRATVARESDRAAEERRKCCPICDYKLSHMGSLSISNYQM